MIGKYYHELKVGQIIQHSLGRTLIEMDNVLFSSLTLNNQPLHINADYASKTEFGRPIMNELFTLGLAVWLTTTLIAKITIRSPK